MGVPEEEGVRPEEDQVAYGNGMVVDVPAILVVELQNWECLRNDKCRRGTSMPLRRR